jgi:hypothetical protein
VSNQHDTCTYYESVHLIVDSTRNRDGIGIGHGSISVSCSSSMFTRTLQH